MILKHQHSIIIQNSLSMLNNIKDAVAGNELFTRNQKRLAVNANGRIITNNQQSVLDFPFFSSPWILWRFFPCAGMQKANNEHWQVGVGY